MHDRKMAAICFLIATAVFSGLAASGAAPRERTEMNFHWRWHAGFSTHLLDSTPLTLWHWRPAMRKSIPTTIPAGLSESGGWKIVRTGTDVFHGRIGFAWFQTTLPALIGSHRAVRFENVDDNGTVYLNGKKLQSHRGYQIAFTVGLDSAWKTDGPNVLTVLVENTAGPGGITGGVDLGCLEPSTTPQSEEFNDRTWRKVQLPDDYIVRGKFSSHANRDHGYLPVFPAWYRRTFTIPSSDRGKVIEIYFEGVYRDARVYINAHLVAKHPGGYAGFVLNIAKYIHFGTPNVLAVHVNPEHFEGWWYEGGGIYRNVWLLVKPRLHVAQFGTYVISHVDGVIHRNASSGDRANASLKIQTTLCNKRRTTATFTIVSSIFDPQGKRVAQISSEQTLNANARKTFNQSVAIQHAALWSLNHTNLYHLHTRISQARKTVDETSTTFGIRTIRFDANRGFFLNGKRVELDGTCNHQDFPAVGIGAPNNLWWWRVMMLKKELHANAYRTSHNPVAPVFYRACDHLGMLVMDENRHLGDTQSPKSSMGVAYQHLSALQFMILRDRNHPSIIMWSMCNEEWGLQATKYGEKVFRTMMKEVHKYDRTRPITCAMNGGYPHGITHVEDILGINYNPGAYAVMHKLLPKLPIFGSETGSTCSDRGVFKNGAKAGLVSQYSMHPGWAQLAWEAWKPIATQSFVAGGFNWTGFDYRGEPTPYAWPDINSHFGLLDICGFPKPDAYYYKAWWGHKPRVYICPQWDLPSSMAGTLVLIRCYSNCHRVELLLNGKKIGEKKMPKYEYLDWHVPYQPGELVARGFDGGKLVATWIQPKAGPAAALRFSDQWPNLRANGEDIAPIAVEVVDTQGHVVRSAMNMVHFTVRGAGTLVGSGNGNPACHEPNQAAYHRAFYGDCMVLVRAGHQAGKITLTVRAKGLLPAVITIRTQAPVPGN